MTSTDRTHSAARNLAVLLLSIGSLWTGAGCGHHADVTTESTPPSATPTVQVTRPERKTLRRMIEQPARVEAFEQTPIFAKIPGYVQRVNVEIGARVRKGDVLAELWVPELVEQVRQKETLVAQARIEIDQSERALAVSRASVETARSQLKEAAAARKRAASAYERWKSESERIGKLVRGKVIDAESGDETANQFRVAGATLEESDAKVASADAAIREAVAKQEKAGADVAAARNRLQVAEADRRQTQAMLDYARIPAPFDGVVSQRHVDTGHFLQPGTSGGANHNEPLFVVVRIDRVRVFLEVPEADAVLVSGGVPARLRIPVLNDQEFAGKVAGSSWSLEPSQRTLRAEIDFDNPDGRLRPGMYAHAIVEAAEPGAMTIPSRSVLTRDGATFCYRVVGGKAVRTPVKIGVREGTQYEVLKLRLPPSEAEPKPRWVNPSGDEDVVASDPGELADGQEVQVAGK